MSPSTTKTVIVCKPEDFLNKEVEIEVKDSIRDLFAMKILMLQIFSKISVKNLVVYEETFDQSYLQEEVEDDDEEDDEQPQSKYIKEAVIKDKDDDKRLYYTGEYMIFYDGFDRFEFDGNKVMKHPMKTNQSNVFRYDSLAEIYDHFKTLLKLDPDEKNKLIVFYVEENVDEGMGIDTDIRETPWFVFRHFVNGEDVKESPGMHHYPEFEKTINESFA